MFQTGKQNMTDMWRPVWTHTVTNLKNNAWVENAVHKDRRQTIHFLTIKLNMNIRTVHPNIRHLGCLKLCSQCVPSTRKQAQEASHVPLNIWSAIIHHTEGDVYLWQTIRSCITILIPHENQQPYKGDTLIQPNQRNSSKKHLSEK